jgi:CheY-like chemotaxis protein
MRVLYVDDDLDDVEIFQMALRKVDPNIDCVVAENGVEALKLLESFIPDHAFIDINMPILNGCQLLAEIKSHAPWRNIPVVMLSTSASTKDIEFASQFEVLYIEKPMNLDEFVILLREVLKPTLNAMGGR